MPLDHPPAIRQVVVHEAPDAHEVICPGTWACSIIDQRGTCWIIIPRPRKPGSPGETELLRHERRHCSGKGPD